jgi:hypothetical protein
MNGKKRDIPIEMTVGSATDLYAAEEIINKILDKCICSSDSIVYVAEHLNAGQNPDTNLLRRSKLNPLVLRSIRIFLDDSCIYTVKYSKYHSSYCKQYVTSESPQSTVKIVFGVMFHNACILSSLSHPFNAVVEECYPLNMINATDVCGNRIPYLLYQKRSDQLISDLYSNTRIPSCITDDNIDNFGSFKKLVREVETLVAPSESVSNDYVFLSRISGITRHNHKTILEGDMLEVVMPYNTIEIINQMIELYCITFNYDPTRSNYSIFEIIFPSFDWTLVNVYQKLIVYNDNIDEFICCTEYIHQIILTLLFSSCKVKMHDCSTNTIIDTSTDWILIRIMAVSYFCSKLRRNIRLIRDNLIHLPDIEIHRENLELIDHSASLIDKSVKIIQYRRLILALSVCDQFPGLYVTEILQLIISHP